MPTRETAPIGAPCWVDLMTSDTARSREFYSQLFGWEADEPAEEFGGYFNFAKDGVRVAGCMAAQPDSGMPDVWSVYLATDDAEKTAGGATAHGGQVYVEPMVVGDFGTMVVLADSGGAGIGAWQADSFQGFGVLGEPGTPAWFELHTRDYEAAVAFYRDVFRWETEAVGDSDDFRYTIQVHDGAQLAGIMDASAFLPEGVPAHWSVYFMVDDADAALASIVDLGGSVVQPAEDTPYGRLATAADPTGARFKLLGRNPDVPASTSAD